MDDKQYLEGKYGADPYLRRIIDWGKSMPKKQEWRKGIQSWQFDMQREL